MHSTDKLQSAFILKFAEDTLDPYWSGVAGGRGGGVFGDYVKGTTGNPMKAEDYAMSVDRHRAMWGLPASVLSAILGWKAGGGIARSGGATRHSLIDLFSKLSGGGAGASIGGGVASYYGGSQRAQALAAEHNKGVLGYDPSKLVGDLKSQLVQSQQRIPEFERKTRDQAATISQQLMDLGRKPGVLERTGRKGDEGISYLGDQFKHLVGKDK